MSDPTSDYLTRLRQPTIAPQSLTRVLYRAVPLEDLFGLAASAPTEPTRKPDVFFASGRANRFNPAGVPTLYLGEDPATAYAEAAQVKLQLFLHRAHASADTGAEQPPTVIVSMLAHLARVLDLTDEGTRDKPGLTLATLRNPWRVQSALGLKAPTLELAEAAHASSHFEAIRYPSDKAWDAYLPQGHELSCVAVFLDRLAAPSFLQVHDPVGTLFKRLP